MIWTLKNTEDLLCHLKLLSSALDQIQKDSCSIAEDIDAWTEMPTFKDSFQ